MDLRLADPADIAARRVELDKTRPVAKDTPEGGQLTTYSALKANGHANRPKSPRDSREARKRKADHERPAVPETEEPEPEDIEESQPSQPTDDEPHILDVRV